MKIELGATRRVFIFKKFVIKIPNIQQYNLFLHGILANLQENLFSGIHSDLANVIWCDKLGLILIMEKAKILNNEDWDIVDILIKKYEDDEMKEFLLSDFKPSNWGYINNKLVKVDYGN